MQDIGVSEYDAELFPNEVESSQNIYTKTVAEVHRELRAMGWTL
jgi:hypothetical protein